MHTFLGFSGDTNTALWQVDEQIIKVDRALPRLEQLQAAYSQVVELDGTPRYDLSDYQVLRLIEYREIPMDTIIEAIFEPSTAASVNATRNAIKAKYPKPS